MSRSDCWKSVRKKRPLRCCLPQLFHASTRSPRDGSEVNHNETQLSKSEPETKSVKETSRKRPALSEGLGNKESKEKQGDALQVCKRSVDAQTTGNDSGIGLLDKQSSKGLLQADDEVSSNKKISGESYTEPEAIRSGLMNKQASSADKSTEQLVQGCIAESTQENRFDTVNKRTNMDNIQANDGKIIKSDMRASAIRTGSIVKERIVSGSAGVAGRVESTGRCANDEKRCSNNGYFVKPYQGSKAIIMFTSDRLCFKEDLEREPEQVYAKFMHAHRCYDLIPNSSKLVVFDTQLSVKKAFFALLYNNVRAAPLWDAKAQDFTGMLTISDFIVMLAKYYKSPNNEIEQLEHQRISDWKEAVNTQKPFIYTEPDQSLLEAVRLLLQHRVHRLPVLDAVTGNPLCILTHKRLLKFMFLYMNDLPQPSYMFSSLRDLGIGTYDNIATARLDTPVICALKTFVDRRVSALPIVDDDLRVIDLYSKFDVINLAARKSYDQLDIKLQEAMKPRDDNYEVLTAQPSDTLQQIVAKLADKQVHRLVLVDSERRVVGVVSLSDILNFLVLKDHPTDPELTTENEVEPEQSRMSALKQSRSRGDQQQVSVRDAMSQQLNVDEIGVNALLHEDQEAMETAG